MYESNLAENAYTSSSPHTGTPRGVEYKLLARVTRQLTASEDDAGPNRLAERAQAIYDNERLWRTLAADVAESGNRLPKELRSKILYLYEFTRQHSRKVMQGAATAKILIEVNTAVMRGIMGAKVHEEAAS